jgi:L-asparaginase
MDLAWYTEARQRLEAGELLMRLPELESVAHVEEIPFRRLSSHALVDRDWLDLAATVNDLLRNDRADGVVITHGTNTLEETAYFLTLCVNSDRPTVLVGAMRPASGLSADGYLNLLNAVRVAASPAVRGHGALVVLNDTIHSARDVTKTATFRVETFQGRDLGPLGYADADGRVVLYHRTARRHTVDSEFSLDGLAALPRVDVVVSYVGADGSAIDACVAAGARGLVSAGTGSGRPTPAEDEALDRAIASGVVVCQSSRVGSGRVVRSPGLQARAIVAADNLQPWKARVLLSLALTRTSDPDVVQRMFDVY